MERIVYFKTPSPYPNDFTKFCSLNGIEIDNNFLTLEGRDIKSISAEGNYIIITLYNGKQLKANISSIYGSYKAGEGIDKEKFDSEKIIETNAELIKTTELIKVRGARIGEYEDSDEILAGTSVQDILEKMLNRVYDVVPIKPVSNINITINGDNPIREYYEVGEILNAINIKIGLDDDGASLGYFVGEEGWEGHRVSAGCNFEKSVFLYNGGEIHSTEDRSEVYTGFSFGTEKNLEEGEHVFGTRIHYKQSVTPQRSDGSESSVIIPAGFTEEANTSFTAAYKYYYGYIVMNPWAKYNNIVENREQLSAMKLQSGWCSMDEDNIINTMESNGEKTAMILVLPEKYKAIKYAENALGVPINIEERWVQQTDESGEPLTFQYTNGTKTTTYYAYILHSLLPVKYNKITFGKGENE